MRLLHQQLQFQKHPCFKVILVIEEDIGESICYSLSYTLGLMITFTLHVIGKKCRKQLGKFCSSPPELAQQLYDGNTVSTTPDAGCIALADTGKASHYSH